jgi:predicted DNA-binding transcriptional regulator AlpA
MSRRKKARLPKAVMVAMAAHARASKAIVSTNAGDPAPTPLIKRYLNKRQVMERVGRGYPTLWQWMRQNRFPRAFMVEGKLAWLEHEISDWMDRQPRVRLKGDGEAA